MQNEFGGDFQEAAKAGSQRKHFNRGRVRTGYKSRTGQLERAVNTRMLNDLSSEVFIDNGIAAYAGFVHNGSAPHRILPNGKKALRWVKNGAFQFARSVNHPGYKGDPFLYTAADDKKREVLNTFDRYAELAKEDIATELVKG